MKHAPALIKRANLLILAGIMAAATLLPALLMQRVSAYTQPTERSIDIATSEAAAADVVYTVTFKPATTGNIRTIIVDFCDSPLIGTVCATVGGSAGLNTNEATLGVYNESGTGFSTAWTVDTAESTTNKVVIKDAAGTSVTAGNAISFQLGNGTAGNGITNPTGTGSFYARILTYSTDTAGDTYDSTTTGANNPPAATVDAGGVAMSTANQITINARVQEVLTFCVGTTDADPTNATDGDCADISGTVVDLGVVQSGTPNISPVSAVNGGNDLGGLAMVRTNGVNGVVIDYFAEAVTGDAGAQGYAGGLGALRVSGSTCTGNGTIATGAKTDQCFNSAGTTQLVFAGADEGFGMTASAVNVTNGTTTNLVRDAEYDGNGTNAGGNGWAWSQTTTDTLASSTGSAVKVVDDEMLVLTFAAQAAVTTPTGQYGVTSTYVATASY
ncbi:MAG: hypothetical protein M3Q79_02590 [bacterium]|nr:hypothetical protein [bacterium]